MTNADERVELVPYDERWPGRFTAEATIIAAAIGPWITGGIHHVGSTAVPGLAAKPVIDIQVGVADLDGARPCIEILEALGYCYAPHRADIMHWFCKPDPRRRTHHLHLVPTGSARFTDVLAFRDLLRADQSARSTYLGRKRELAAAHPNDREAYTAGKADLVSALTRTAHARGRARQQGALPLRKAITRGPSLHSRHDDLSQSDEPGRAGPADAGARRALRPGQRGGAGHHPR